ncbi:hypothetical protein AGMMS50256_32160 [Betaproteobacteria bacterium]|nr:hypothetical protein AGMMS50256_32160 [Betaproteobacteria bacterium]
MYQEKNKTSKIDFKINTDLAKLQCQKQRERYKKIGSLIGFTLLVGRTLIAIPFVSTGCSGNGDNMIEEISNIEELRAYNGIFEPKNGVDYTSVGWGNNMYDQKMLDDISPYFNVGVIKETFVKEFFSEILEEIDGSFNVT